MRLIRAEQRFKFLCRDELISTAEESQLAELSRKFLFVGKDYENWIFRDADELEHPEEGMFISCIFEFNLKAHDKNRQF